jgi:hypothetical protein
MNSMVCNWARQAGTRQQRVRPRHTPAQHTHADTCSAEWNTTCGQRSHIDWVPAGENVLEQHRKKKTDVGRTHQQRTLQPIEQTSRPGCEPAPVTRFVWDRVIHAAVQWQ